jgi:dihydropteroate synthase
MPLSTPRSTRCSPRNSTIATTVRVLRSAVAADSVRLAQYVDSDALPAAREAASALPLVVDDPPPDTTALLRALREGGAFAEISGPRAVIVAPRALLARHAQLHPLAAALLQALDAAESPPSYLRLRERALDLATPRVMGILNVTPDSFYDRYSGLDAARARAAEMVRQGAAIIDVGGQSYAAGRPLVSDDEERARVVPAIEALVRDGIDAALSVDTARASVARAALAAGAHLVNDCSGLADREMEHAVAEAKAALVVMHLKGELRVRAADYSYDDALGEICAALRALLDRALAAGVAADALVADPGLEFGKEPRTDLEILDRFAELGALGVPLLLASSRKRFLERVLDLPADELLVPSIATAAQGILAGAAIVRTHDVAETVLLARTLAASRAALRPAIALAP